MEEIRLTSWYGKYPMIYKVLYIPGSAGFLNHQQYVSRMVTQPFNVFFVESLSRQMIGLPQLKAMKWPIHNNMFFGLHPQRFLTKDPEI